MAKKTALAGARPRRGAQAKAGIGTAQPREPKSSPGLYQCTSCRHDHLLPLSCKARGLCPSCGGRRMMSLTRHVMDAVLPHVPTRQWVLTLPHALRYRVAYDQPLCTAIHRALASALRKRLRRLARARGDAGAETGSVAFVQRWGSGLNLNPHYHVIALDGWFHRAADGQLSFTRAPAPTQPQVEALLLDVHARVMRLLGRRGLLEADAADALACDAPALSACYEGAVTQRVGLGPMRGRPVIKLGVSLSQHLASAHERVERVGRLCARVDGLDLHGRVAFGAADRTRLQELVRYCARPPLAYDRLTEQPDGRYLLRLKTRWRDGTTHLLFEPIELMERLAAQIPKPRANLVLYAGVLAPHAKLRAQAIVHDRPEPLPQPPATETQTRGECDSWSELMRVTFGLDVLQCPRCGGRLKHIATILDSRVARRILEHLGRPARAPPVAPARDPAPFWASWKPLSGTDSRRWVRQHRAPSDACVRGAGRLPRQRLILLPVLGNPLCSPRRRRGAPGGLRRKRLMSTSLT